jgi:hypothetical protein
MLHDPAAARYVPFLAGQKSHSCLTAFPFCRRFKTKSGVDCRDQAGRLAVATSWTHYKAMTGIVSKVFIPRPGLFKLQILFILYVIPSLNASCPFELRLPAK